MKNLKYTPIFAVLMSVFLCFNASAGHIGEFHQDLSVKINCDNCIVDNEREVTIQLFADDEPVDGATATLNKDSDYTTSFTDLDVFRGEKTPEEIVYDVRVEENGKYRKLDSINVVYVEQEINQWIQVSPEDMQEGHQYVLLTENWNYAENGYDKYALMNGHLELNSITPLTNFQIINGKKSYYSLDGEPRDDELWTFEKLSSTDPDYEGNENAWILTNNIDGKKLVLSSFDKGDYYDTIWRYSGKNGYNVDENSINTNKLSLLSVDDNRGRFRIAASLWEDDDELGPYYLGVNHFYQMQAQTEPDYAAQFLAFEHVVTTAQVATNLEIEYELCPNETPVNPNTSDPSMIALATLALGSGVAYFIYHSGRRR